MTSKRILGVLFSGVVILALIGCAGEPTATDPEPGIQAESVIEEEAPATEADDSAEAASTETTIPRGARPASDTFPFPVPEDWAEVEPFMEEKIGGSMGMYGTYEYPGDANSAATLYEDLLKSAGFIIHPNPLGETVHEASFIVEGNVNGNNYTGGIDFDAVADGMQLASINLQQD